MKKLITLFALLTIALVSGCGTLAPIKTQLEMDGITYHSEKDILFEKTVLPDGSEEIKFQAVASAPAQAQAERDLVQAEANAKQADAISAMTQPMMAAFAEMMKIYKNTPQE